MAVVPRWYGGFFYCPMLFWAVILGVYMGWLESVTRDKPRDIPDPDSDAYMETPDISCDIPERYQRHVPYEPCPPAVEEAERVVRSGR